MKTAPQTAHTLRKGWGFDVGQDFARANEDTPIALAPTEYAKPGCVIGYIAENPASSLGFLRIGSKGLVRIHCRTDAVFETPTLKSADRAQIQRNEADLRGDAFLMAD